MATYFQSSLCGKNSVIILVGHWIEYHWNTGRVIMQKINSHQMWYVSSLFKYAATIFIIQYTCVLNLKNFLPGMR